MRNYVIDELPRADLERLAERLDAMELASSMGGLYWLPLPEGLLEGLQQEHAACTPSCAPACALELGEDFVRLELLVRSMDKMACPCTAFATPAQRAHLMDWLDALFTELGIRP